MSIECVHVYHYSANQTYKNGLDLPLRDYSESQLAITNIEGVSPVSATINVTQYAARDGGMFNSSRRGERHITITMKLFSSPSMDAVREKVYNAAPVGKPITLVFDWSDGVSKAIDGYVEDTPSDYFGDQEGIQISVVCPDPDFRIVKKGEDTYETVVNYKQFNYPNKTFMLNKGDDLTIEWLDACKDETEQFTIDSMFNIKNNTSQKQKYLFAIAFLSDWKELLVNFYSSRFQFIQKPINEYVDSLDEATFEEGIYFIKNDNGYKEVTTELEFNYLTQTFNALAEAKEWEANKYYKRSDAPNPGIWMPVTWDANYADEEDPQAAPYRVIYGFLTNDLNDGEITNSIVSIFDDEVSYFTTAAKAFFVLSKSGTNLTELVPFQPNTYYKLNRVYSKIENYNGWTLVKDDDPVYFYEGNYDAYLHKGIIDGIPLYGFSRIEKVYAVSNETYNASRYYYMNGNVETLLTGNSAPSDWPGVSKYYSKVEKFYQMTNYVNASSRLGGRYIYDVMLDYMTYKYEPINESIPYESGAYYVFVGNATTQLKGLYGFTSIKVYAKIEGSTPSDWGEPGKYFTRTRKSALEREETLYLNDHAYLSIKNRGVTEYEILTEEPDDWDTNYSDYFTLEDDFSNIIAYFMPDEYPNYEKQYEILTEEPDDWSDDFANYFERTDDYSMLFKKTGYEIANVIPSSNDENTKSIMSLIKNEDGTTNYLLGDINGNIESFVYKSVNDTYYSGKFYTYNQTTQNYILVTSSTAPSDFYTESYKYFKKEVAKCDYIPKMVIIFWNPSTGMLEYDIDHYSMFISDFKKWADCISSEIKWTDSLIAGKQRNARLIDGQKDAFITYSVTGQNILTNNLDLDVGNNYILSKTFNSDGTPSYDHLRVIGIRSQIK